MAKKKRIHACRTNPVIQAWEIEEICLKLTNFGFRLLVYMILNKINIYYYHYGRNEDIKKVKVGRCVEHPRHY